MEKYKQVGAIYPCKIMDKNGKVKKIIYPKDMDMSYQETINRQYNKYHRKGKRKAPTLIEKEEVNI